MTNPAPPNLGNIISNPTIRKVIYGVYAASAVAVGGITAYFFAIAAAVPEPVVGAQGVIAYLGIAVGSLALANTPSTPPE